MTARQTGLLVLLGAIWGAAFMLIKIAVTGRKKPAAKSSHIRDFRRCDS
jgi:hypothetical protein